MKRGSLRLRLLAAGAMSIFIALAIAGIGLQFLFERHVERLIVQELESYLRQLVSGIETRPDGRLQLAKPLAEARFSEPLSGLYWQVSSTSISAPLRSRSLWDSALVVPNDALGDGEVHSHVIAGPGGASLLAVERAVTLPKSQGGDRVRVVVAIDRGEIKSAGRAFMADLLPFLVLLATVLMLAAWLQVTVGLKPLDIIRNRLAEVRAGRRAELGIGFPDEVLPLAAEVDMLLAAQEAAIQRARARAADLAHALRTPLSVLQSDADALRSQGDAEIADEIASVADGMLRHVERELALARSGARVSAGTQQSVMPVVEQIVRVLSRLPAGRNLDFEIAIPADLRVAVDTQDLTEIVGSLGENAMKWARGRVVFGARSEPGVVTLMVDDDGPGIPESEIATVLSRGGRMPQNHAGSGLGLAIVGDIAQAYGGSLRLGVSEIGGLKAEIALPPCGSVELKTPASGT